MSGDEQSILITTEIHPLKGGKRRVTLSGAPEGEMPVIARGEFASRHQLADQVFAQLVKRKPQGVKRAKTQAPKRKSGQPKQLSLTVDDGPANGEAKNLGLLKEADQIGPEADGELVPPADLPAIEGDTSNDSAALDAVAAELAEG